MGLLLVYSGGQNHEFPLGLGLGLVYSGGQNHEFPRLVETILLDHTEP